jgi:hypothetical protein
LEIIYQISPVFLITVASKSLARAAIVLINVEEYFPNFPAPLISCLILAESTVSIKDIQQFCEPPVNDISSASINIIAFN